MVEALVAAGDTDASYALITKLSADRTTKHLVNGVIYCSILKGFSHKREFERVWKVYQEMLRSSVQLSLVAFNTLIDSCARCKQMSYITDIILDMQKNSIEPNLITYSSILKGYCQENRLERAFELLATMRETTKFVPDEIMYNSLLDGCARLALYDRGMTVLDEMLEAKVAPSNFTLSVLVKLAGRGRKLRKAFELCDTLSANYTIKLNVHVFSNLIHACIQQQELNRAFETFDRMLRENVRPDVRTYTLLLRACIESRSADDLKRVPTLLRFAAGERPGAEPQSPLPSNVVTEVVEAIERKNEGLAISIIRELKHSRKIHFDSKLKFRLATKAVPAP